MLHVDLQHPESQLLCSENAILTNPQLFIPPPCDSFTGKLWAVGLLLAYQTAAQQDTQADTSAKGVRVPSSTQKRSHVEAEQAYHSLDKWICQNVRSSLKAKTAMI